MRREFHVRFWESPEGRFLRATRLIILVSVPPGARQYERARDVAMTEKAALAAFLGQELGLELSETKTLVTPVTRVMRFLGHHVCVRDRQHRQRLGEWMSVAVIPKDRSQLLRHRIKDLFNRHTTGGSLGDRLQKLNSMLRGWCNFYRHAWVPVAYLGPSTITCGGRSYAGSRRNTHTLR
jgi:hypothetical protein